MRRRRLLLHRVSFTCFLKLAFDAVLFRPRQRVERVGLECALVATFRHHDLPSWTISHVRRGPFQGWPPTCLNPIGRLTSQILPGNSLTSIGGWGFAMAEDRKYVLSTSDVILRGGAHLSYSFIRCTGESYTLKYYLIQSWGREVSVSDNFI